MFLHKYVHFYNWCIHCLAQYLCAVASGGGAPHTMMILWCVRGRTGKHGCHNVDHFHLVVPSAACDLSRRRLGHLLRLSSTFLRWRLSLEVGPRKSQFPQEIISSSASFSSFIRAFSSSSASCLILPLNIDASGAALFFTASQRQKKVKFGLVSLIFEHMFDNSIHRDDLLAMCFQMPQEAFKRDYRPVPSRTKVSDVVHYMPCYMH